MIAAFTIIPFCCVDEIKRSGLSRFSMFDLSNALEVIAVVNSQLLQSASVHEALGLLEMQGGNFRGVRQCRDIPFAFTERRTVRVHRI